MLVDAISFTANSAASLSEVRPICTVKKIASLRRNCYLTRQDPDYNSHTTYLTKIVSRADIAAILRGILSSSQNREGVLTVGGG